MKNFRRVVVLALSAMMVLSLAACGKKDKGAITAPPITELRIGTWWLQYYDSTCTALTDDPSYVAEFVEPAGWAAMTEEQKADEKTSYEHNQKVAQMKLDVVRELEKKYGMNLVWDNLTYTGVTDSIDNSIKAGKPDCGAYLVELAFGIPAQVNNYAADLRALLDDETVTGDKTWLKDLLGDQKHVQFLDLGDNRACIFKRVTAQSAVEGTYPLGFNVQKIKAANLEDPRELYAKGQWTWDKFFEYCKKLTDKENGEYGFSGFVGEVATAFILSNGSNIAAGQTEALTSAKTAEALEKVVELYKNYSYPYDYEGEPWNSMRFCYKEGHSAFFEIAAWIADTDKDYDPAGDLGVTLPFDTAYVPWPVGPSGDQATNFHKVTAGEYYIIPATLSKDDQLKVFNMLCDYWNWYNGDVSLRDAKHTLSWWYKSTAKDPQLQVDNFNVMQEMGMHEINELGMNLGVNYDWNALLKEEVTVAQFQETYKQEVQDALNKYYGK